MWRKFLSATSSLVILDVLFTRTFHPFQELRKVPDLKICGYLALFEIDFPVLEIEWTFE
jgi:hypothetical protein